MAGEQTSLRRLGLQGFLRGAAGVFPVSVLVLWLHNNDLWPLDTDFDWSNVFALTIGIGSAHCLSSVITERRRRKQVLEGGEDEEPGPTEPAETGKAS
ncbi:hypothetical protein [Planobispora longispora]|uniref:Uncharacterized protein n=1 Tax=Planobispora longispora TaxID=28887 RepID=A0A8J3RHP9_9ACTN|nr:hypothetical protein [Planobispora longispora]BFE85182.1 hypothetical protein GCM10020093_077830 [Planobispora longispora]GIH75158.1 hypothetical protein Plo01_15870 [Planobispora longispora]